MRTRRLAALLALLAPHALAQGPGGTVGAAPAGVADAYAPWKGETALGRYVARDDGAFAWSLAGSRRIEGATVHELRMTSQRWRDAHEVDQPLWTHWVTIVEPVHVARDTAILVIGGGRRRETPRDRAPDELLVLARATGAVVVQVDNVPNQPLAFAGDAEGRMEDAILAHTWIQAMESGDPETLGRFPMVKAAVRAMDAAEAFLSERSAATGAEPGSSRDLKPEGWFVLGGSKRGWTTWLTAAVDGRVRGIAPLVIDVLNLPGQLEHHYESYGFWAPALDDYVREGVVDHIGDPRLTEVFRHEDPLLYQERITVPVYIVNASGDQFFPTDSAGQYIDRLTIDWRLRVEPNAEHSLKGTRALDEVAAFYLALVDGVERPRLTWEHEADEEGDRLVVHASARPREVVLWSAENPSARDFRVDTIDRSWTARALGPRDAGSLSYETTVGHPATGWRAYFVECRFDGHDGLPGLVFTTRVFVTPDTLPGAGSLSTRQP